MNKPDVFEERLLAVLKDEVILRSAVKDRAVWRGRLLRPRLAALVGAGVLASILTAGLPVLIGQNGSGAAWAVKKDSDGSVRVEIREPKDAAGLERRLAEVGVPAYVTFAPPGMTCSPEGSLEGDDPHHPVNDPLPFEVESTGNELTALRVWPERFPGSRRLSLTFHQLEIDAKPVLGQLTLYVIRPDAERCKLHPQANDAPRSPVPAEKDSSAVPAAPAD